MMNKIWKIRGVQERFTDEELIYLIQKGSLNGNNYIATQDMKQWIKIEDSIYQYYLKEKTNETIQ